MESKGRAVRADARDTCCREKGSRALPKPGVRNSTHLLDLMPADTVVYAALPNLANTIAESHRVIQERISQNPALREWWEKEQSGRQQNMDQAIETIRQFGDYLGDEIAVSVALNGDTKPDAPLVLAELKNSTGLREFMEQQIAKYSAGQTGKPDIQFVEDPSKAIATSTDGRKERAVFTCWIRKWFDGWASPKLQQFQSLQQVNANGGTSGFIATPFHDRIAQVYSAGAGLL